MACWLIGWGIKNVFYFLLFWLHCYVFYLFDGGFGYLFMITVFMAIFYNTLQPVLDSLSLKLVKRILHFLMARCG